MTVRYGQLFIVHQKGKTIDGITHSFYDTKISISLRISQLNNWG